MEENYESRRGFLRTMAMSSAVLASGGFAGCDVQKNRNGSGRKGV